MGYETSKKDAERARRKKQQSTKFSKFVRCLSQRQPKCSSCRCLLDNLNSSNYLRIVFLIFHSTKHTVAILQMVNSNNGLLSVFFLYSCHYYRAGYQGRGFVQHFPSMWTTHCWPNPSNRNPRASSQGECQKQQFLEYYLIFP